MVNSMYSSTPLKKIDASITFLLFLWSYGVCFVAVIADSFAALHVTDNWPPWGLRGRNMGPGRELSRFLCSSYPFSSSYSLLISSSSEKDLLPSYQYYRLWRLCQNSVLSDGHWCYYELHYPLFLPFLDSSCFPPLLPPPTRQQLVGLLSSFPSPLTL